MRTSLKLFIIMTAFIACNNVLAEGRWETYTNTDTVIDIKFQDHYLWCATTGGVVRWDTRDMSAVKFTTSDGLNKTKCTSIGVAPDGDIWVGFDSCSNGNITRYNGSSWELFDTNHNLGKMVSCITFEEDGTMWAGTDLTGYCGPTQGLTRYDGETWSNFLEGGRFTDVEVGPDGTVWAAMNILYKFDGTDLVEYKSSNDTTIYAEDIAFDLQGNMWIACDNDGIGSFDGSEWHYYTQGNCGLPLNDVKKISIGYDGTLYVAGSLPEDIHQWAIASYDGETWQIYGTESGFDGNRVSVLRTAPNGTIWAGSGDVFHNGSGLYQFEGTQWISHYVPSEPPFNAFEHFHQMEDGNAIAVIAHKNDPSSSVLTLFDGTEWNIINNPDVNPRNIRTFLPDNYGSVWVCERDRIHNYNNGNWNTWIIDDINVRGFAKDGNNILVLSSEAIYRFMEGVIETTTIPVPFQRTPLHIHLEFLQDDVWMMSENELFRVSGNEIVDKGITQNAHYNILAASSVGEILVSWYNEDFHYLISVFRNGGWVDIMDFGNDSINNITFDDKGTTWVAHSNGITAIKDDASETYPVGTWPTVITTGLRNDIWIGTIGGLIHYIPDSSTDINEPTADSSPSPLSINGNSQNPFNPATSIGFTLPSGGRAELAIYAITGQKVATLVEGFLPAGAHTARWNGRGSDGTACSSGVYFAVLKADGHTTAHRMLLVK